MAKQISRTAKLARDLAQYRAFDILTLAHAHKAVSGLSSKKYMASGLILQITDLSGNVVLGPVAISNGLSPETIAAIQADIAATHADRLSISKI